MADKESGSFLIEIIDPSGVVSSDKAYSVILPVQNGEVGILPDHRQYTALLKSGEVRYQTSSGSTKSFAVDGGILNFKDNKLLILANTCVEGGVQ